MARGCSCCTARAATASSKAAGRLRPRTSSSPIRARCRTAASSTLARPFDQDTDLGGDLVMVDTRDYVENTQALAASFGLTGPAQSRGHAEPGHHRRRPLARRPLPLGLSAVGWQRPHPGELVAVPTAGHHGRHAGARALHRCAAGRPELRAGAAAVQRASCSIRSNNTFKPLFLPVEGVMISDLVAAAGAARRCGSRAPTSSIRCSPTRAWACSASAASTTSTAPRRTPPSAPAPPPARRLNRTIAMLADPTLCTADDRPARFIRIEEAVSRFDRDLDMSLPDIDFGAAVGSGVGFMRVILGYAPIEPDGSVSIRVPANVPFTILHPRQGRPAPAAVRPAHLVAAAAARRGAALQWLPRGAGRHCARAVAWPRRHQHFRVGRHGRRHALPEHAGGRQRHAA